MKNTAWVHARKQNRIVAGRLIPGVVEQLISPLELRYMSDPKGEWLAYRSETSRDAYGYHSTWLEKMESTSGVRVGVGTNTLMFNGLMPTLPGETQHRSVRGAVMLDCLEEIERVYSASVESDYLRVVLNLPRSRQQLDVRICADSEGNPLPANILETLMEGLALCP